MRALVIDYAGVPRRAVWTRRVLVVIAIAFALDTGYRYIALQREIERTTRTLTQAQSLQGIAAPAATRVRYSADEYNFARQTLGRLATPWDTLFEALEAAHSKDVVLVSIEPDAENRTVMITGEARNYLAALGYLANLGQQKSLKRVHLVRHEIRQQVSLRPLLFSISAGWEERR